MNDLDEELGYDADHDDPRQYCEHGTFIGSWWGPDYLCHWCEAGVSAEEAREAQRAQLIRQLERKIEAGERMCEFFRVEHWDRPGMMIAKVVPYVMTYYGPAFDQLAELEGTHA